MYYIILGYRNNWIIMNLLDDVTDNVDCECIIRTILGGNYMIVSLINIEVNYGTIDDDYSTCHGYNIIIFSSSPYTLQVYCNMDGQFVYSGEMICKGTYHFLIIINYNYYDSPK